ncbi:MAG: CehA/McbA family metallohydrolase [Armatimonadota bacterium]
MDREPVALIIQPAPDTSYWEAGFCAKIENGRLLSVQGMGGVTQPEDIVGILHKDDYSVRWQSFLWSHYAAMYLLIDWDDDTILVMEDGGTLKISDIGQMPSRITTGDNGALLVGLYEPVIEGEFCITPDVVHTGETTEFEIEFTVGESGIDTGGGLKVQTPFSSWSFPKLFDGAVTLTTSGNAKIETSLYPYFHPMAVFGYVYAIKVTEGRLEPGDVIHIRYTDGESGIRVQTYVKDYAFFPAYIDARATGIYYPISFDYAASVSVMSGPPARLRLAAPMVVAKDEPFDVSIIVLDEHYNPVYDSFSGNIRFKVDASDIDAEYDLESENCGMARFKGVFIPEPGYSVISLESEGLTSASIVVKCVDGPVTDKLYWGAIHGHTALSDGEGNPEDYYPYGRNIGLLDFAAMADHDWELTEHERSRIEGGFKYTQDLADEYNDPGNFVTLSGYEWMGNEGHANVYYNNEELDNPIHIGNISVVDRAEALSFSQLLALYKGRDDVIIIPHTSHGFKWTEYDPALMPAVEIYSCWGPSESRDNPAIGSAQDGLRKGFKLAFIGGADSHHSSPGHTGKPSKYHVLGWREGFAAVYAPELTRDGIFNGIRQKHCYATTAERILLEFSVNGSHMGSSISVNPGDTLKFEGAAGGTSPIKTIELLCNSKVIHTIEGKSLIEMYEHEIPVAESGQQYYYLRISQSDDEKAWSSPVWVDCV